MNEATIKAALRIHLGRAGKIGGRARAEALTAERRREIAMMGVKARLAKYPKVEKPVKPKGKRGRPKGAKNKINAERE